MKIPKTPLQWTPNLSRWETPDFQTGVQHLLYEMQKVCKWSRAVRVGEPADYAGKDQLYYSDRRHSGLLFKAECNQHSGSIYGQPEEFTVFFGKPILTVNRSSVYWMVGGQSLAIFERNGCVDIHSHALLLLEGLAYWSISQNRLEWVSETKDLTLRQNPRTPREYIVEMISRGFTPVENSVKPFGDFV